MDETKVIEATAGPYRGQRLTMPAADADTAIDDGWAVDPTKPIDADASPPELNDEQRSEILAKAETAARKLRGEPEGEPKEKLPTGRESPTATPREANAKRDEKPKPTPGDYETRRSTPKE